MSMTVKWNIFKMCEVAEINPRRPREINSLADDFQVAFVPMPAVNQHLGIIDGAEVRPLKEVRKGFTYFEEGDVLFAKITPCMQNGKSAIARGLMNGLGFGSTEFHVIRPHNDKVIAEWLWYFVRQLHFRQEATHHFRGAVGQQRVPPKYLANAQIPLPKSITDQRRIIDRVEECMVRVEEIENLKSSANQEFQALIPAALEDIFHNNGFQEIPLFDLLREKPKNGVYLSKGEYVESGGIPIIRMGEMFRRFEVEEKVEKSVKTNKKLQDDYGLLEGDVLVARRSIVYEGSGSMAMVTKSNQGGIFESSIIRLRLDTNKILPQFLVAFFHSREGFFRRMSITKKATISGINQQGLKQLLVPCPSIQQQEASLKMVDQVRAFYSELQNLVPQPEISALRDSILRKAFAGEL
jgi:type I restriction enzyme S subunit